MMSSSKTHTFSHASCSSTSRSPLHCNPLCLVLSTIARAIGQGVGVLLAPLTGKIPSFLVASAISIGIGVLLAPLTGGIPLISVASAVALLGMVRFSLVRLFKGFLRTQNQTIGLVHRL